MEYLYLSLFIVSLFFNGFLIFRKKETAIQKKAVDVAGSVTDAAAKISSVASQQLKDLDDYIVLIKKQLDLSHQLEKEKDQQMIDRLNTQVLESKIETLKLEGILRREMLNSMYIQIIFYYYIIIYIEKKKLLYDDYKILNDDLKNPVIALKRIKDESIESTSAFYEQLHNLKFDEVEKLVS